MTAREYMNLSLRIANLEEQRLLSGNKLVRLKCEQEAASKEFPNEEFYIKVGGYLVFRPESGHVVRVREMKEQ